jgi:hypothetical protein
MTAPLQSSISTDLLPGRLVPLGNIKIGGKKPNGTQPVKFDHFRVTQLARGEDGNFLPHEEVHRVVGARPTALDVRLMFDRPAENFHARMVSYSGKTLVRECDGQTTVQPSTGVAGPCVRNGAGCECKPYGRLSVILEASPHYGGLFTFRTTSWASVNNIQTGLRLLAKDFPSLRGLPLSLILYPEQHQVPAAGGKTVAATSYKVGIVLRASWQEAAEAAMEFHRVQQLSRRKILELSSGLASVLDEEDLQDAEGFASEFFPGGSSTRAVSAVGRMNQELLAAGSPAEEADVISPEAVQLLGSIEAAEGIDAPALQRLRDAANCGDAVRIQAAADWLAAQVPAPSTSEDQELI